MGEFATESKIKLSEYADQKRQSANAIALDRMLTAEPVLVGISPAGDVVPGMTPETILTSGAPLEWPEYVGGQRRAIIYAAVYEGLAKDTGDAERLLASGQINVRSTQQHGCVGSVAGIYTASMPVFVVEDQRHGGQAFCNLYEGKSRRRLNYGSYDDDVASGLRWLQSTMGPVLDEALKRSGPIQLKPLMARAMRLGDELHSRNTAASMLLEKRLRGSLVEMAQSGQGADVAEVFSFFDENDYTFLRVGMAAAKAMADAAHGVVGSSLVTGMALNCNQFSIRVSGLGDEWFGGVHPELEGRFFDGFGPIDAEWIGGESCFTEVVGLGGFVQSCAPTLQAYQGGTYEAMCANNLSMYRITLGEHPDFLIPPFDFRGSPVGIDVFRVLEEKLTPVIDGGLAGKDGGQIGAGTLRPGLDSFQAAAFAYSKSFTTGGS